MIPVRISMADEDFAPRLHGLLARSADTAVIIRRGPSTRVATFSWDRRTNEVQLGQWLKGRIYERRSDLTPDGKHLIYFAVNGQRRNETRGSWTAISRAPYLHALDLHAKGDCWEGGGLFPNSGSYWLNNRYASDDDTLRANSGLKPYLDSIAADTTQQVNGMFAGAGRDFSGMNMQTLARGIMQGQAPVVAQQYNQDKQNQIGAANAL